MRSYTYLFKFGCRSCDKSKIIFEEVVILPRHYKLNTLPRQRCPPQPIFIHFTHTTHSYTTQYHHQLHQSIHTQYTHQQFGDLISLMALHRKLASRSLQLAVNTNKCLFDLSRRSLTSSSPEFELPVFDYQPKPYNGPSADEVLAKRQKYLGSSLFYYYKKPVSIYFLYKCIIFHSCD